MAAYLQSFCLMVLATLYVACQGQCIVRALMPSMAVMDCSAGQACGPYEDSSSSATEDLSALLALARALEQDKANNANNGIDVNALLDTLIHAMVCIAKPESSAGGYASGFPKSPIARHPASPSAGQAVPVTPAPAAGSGSAAGGAGNNAGLGGVLDTVVDTVGGLLDGSGAGGLGKVVPALGETVGGLLGGGPGAGGLVDGVGKTVGGVTGGGGGGLVGGLLGGGSSGGSGLGGAVGGLTGGLL